MIWEWTEERKEVTWPEQVPGCAYSSTGDRIIHAPPSRRSTDPETHTFTPNMSYTIDYTSSHNTTLIPAFVNLLNTEGSPQEAAHLTHVRYVDETTVSGRDYVRMELRLICKRNGEDATIWANRSGAVSVDCSATYLLCKDSVQ